MSNSDSCTDVDSYTPGTWYTIKLVADPATDKVDVYVDGILKQSQQGAGDFGQPRVVVPAPSNLRYAHLSWPKIVRASNGNIVVAYLSGTTHRMNGCPAFAVSKDGGESFGPPQILADLCQGIEHSGNVALGVAADSSLALLAMALRSNQSGSTIMGWRSVDAGITWTKVDTSLLHHTAGSVYGMCLQCRAMGWLQRGISGKAPA